MYKLLSIKYCAATNLGMLRENNEDNLAVIIKSGEKSEYSDKSNLSAADEMTFEINLENEFYCAIADGMGGTFAGEVASEIAVKTLAGSISEKKESSLSNNDLGNFLRNIILGAHNKICEESKKDPSKKGMGTTMVLASVTTNGLCISWIGDSRAYMLSPKPLKNRDPRLGLDKLELLTRDHSLIWDQVESGEMTPEEARIHHLSHIITQNLGSLDAKPQPDIAFRSLNKGERILLCSDGLNAMISETQIEKILSLKLPVSEIVNRLINQANEAGGNDNISIVLIEVLNVLVDPVDLEKSPSEFTTSSQEFNKSGSSNLVSKLSILAIIACIIFLLIFIWGKFKNPFTSILQHNTKMDSINRIGERLPKDNGISTNLIKDSALLKVDSTSKMDSIKSNQKDSINRKH